MKTVTFQGWKNCVEIASGKARLVVTAEVGPRIIGIFAGDSPNLAYVNPATAGRKGGDEWRIYGGHRLWHAPEAKPRSYAPDNTAVTVRETRDGIVFCGGTEAATGIHKSFAIKALPKMRFRLTHRLRNETPWDVELAAWALTVMAPGGVAVVPQPKGDKTALLPNRYLTVWPYTDMADARLTWGRDFILLRQDAKAKGPCKFGLNGEGGWLAYANHGAALVKHYEHLVDAEYPDNGCSIECYTNPDMLEIETLSPLYLLAPGEEVVHVEEWQLLPGVGEVRTEKDAAALAKLAAGK